MTNPDLEAVARAIYAKIPTYALVWRWTTTTNPEREQVRIEDTWEEAEDRHKECEDLARAAILADPVRREVIEFLEWCTASRSWAVAAPSATILARLKAQTEDE